MPVSRKIDKTVPTSVIGTPVIECWCRKCMKMKPPTAFYQSYDTQLDTNGYISVCKDCVETIYTGIYLTENSVERTILKMCRMLNLAYNENAIESLNESLVTNKNSEKMIQTNLFGLYKKILPSVSGGRTYSKKSGEDMLFVEPSLEIKQKISDTSFEDFEYYQKQWGIGLSLNEEDYKYLEQEYAKWEKTADCSTQDVEILVREICHTQNKIRKARIAGESTTALVKELQDIMKNSALTPAMKNAATTGRNMETFGVWIKEIESMEPAEWLESLGDDKRGHKIYRDVDNVEGYFQKYFVRPLKNFMLQSKDFNIEDEAISSDEYEDGEEES